jgi:hypothetical protein
MLPPLLLSFHSVIHGRTAVPGHLHDAGFQVVVVGVLVRVAVGVDEPDERETLAELGLVVLDPGQLTVALHFDVLDVATDRLLAEHAVLRGVDQHLVPDLVDEAAGHQRLLTLASLRQLEELGQLLFGLDFHRALVDVLSEELTQSSFLERDGKKHTCPCRRDVDSSIPNERWQISKESASQSSIYPDLFKPHKKHPDKGCLEQ